MKNLFITLIAAVTFIVACGAEPEPINYGKDNCEYCKMLITDSKYGAELITQKGKIFKFDSIECLAAYSDLRNPKEINTMWVVNFYQPNDLINVNDSHFLLSENLRSPMGLYLSAYKEESNLLEIKKQYGGKKINWNELVKYVTSEWN